MALLVETGLAPSARIWCARSGYGFAAIFLVGAVGVAHWFPPLAPSDTAEVTAALYRSDTATIRIGLLIVFLGQILFPFLGAAIAAQTREIPGVGRVFGYVQVAAVGAASIAMVGPLAVFFATAFRPERAPELTRLLNDLGWITFMVAFPPFVAWAVAVGAAILGDGSERPAYPRWSGYLSIMVGLGQSPAGLLIFFTTGPFAWNGIFAFWIPALCFFGWILTITALTVRAARAVV